MSERASEFDDDDLADLPPARRSWLSRTGETVLDTLGRRRILSAIFGCLLAAAFVYFILGSYWVQRIDDDVDFAPPQPVEGGSHAVNMAIALIEREVDTHSWAANDPFFMPGALLDNMPNYQKGVVYAISRFSVEMSDQIGRARGSSQVDQDLDRAAGLLRYPGDRWIIDFSASWAPVASAESQYMAAAEALRRYNQRLAAGEAVFERRADNLLNTLDRIAADLGSSSALIHEHLASQGGWVIDLTADDIFYQTKGRLYGYAMILEALGEDVSGVIENAGLTTVWGELITSLREGAALAPIAVISGAPDSQSLPSHLAAQGFYLLRARTQLREVTSVLMN